MDFAAAYIRVSTEEQTTYSPAAQLEEIKEFARKNEYCIPEEWIFIDEGISGRKAENRPAFQRMIRLARQKNSRLQVILVHKYDRFARSRQDAVLYKSLLKKNGVKVISIKEPVPEDEKFAVIYESMLEAMAEYYSLNLAEEVHKTMQKKAEQGEWQTAAPFGYRNENKSLSVVPEEAEAVRWLFQQYAAGASLPTLARQLNEMGLRTHQGNTFESRAVRYILNNPVYCGYLRWTPGRRTDRDYFTPAAILSKGGWKPIVTETLWESVVQRLQSERQPERRPRPTESHWLSGMVKCSACGHSLAFGAQFKNGAQQMQCSGYSHGKCSVSHAISTARLIPALLSAIETAARNALPFSYMIQQKPQTQENEERAAITLLLEKARLRLRKAKDAYLNGIDTMEEYRETKAKAESEIAELEKRLSLIVQQSPSESFSVPPLPDFFRSDDFSMEEKRLALQAILETAVFEKKSDCLKVIFLWS